MKIKVFRLYHKLLITVLLSTLTGMSIFAFLKLNDLTNEENLEISEKIELLKTYTSLQFSNPVWHFNKPGIQSSVNAFFNDKEIASLTIVSSNGDILSEQVKEGLPYQEKYLTRIQTLIHYENEIIGQVYFDFSSYFRMEHIKKERLSYFFFACMILFLQILFLRLLVKRITTPIDSMRQQTRLISEGNLDSFVVVHSKDELGDLAQDFNQMISQLKQSIEEKNFAYSILEQKVQERTAELYEINLHLTETNEKLQHTLSDLENTQAKLYRTEKMAELTKLVSRIAHEINTPLGNCITTMSYLKEGYDQNTPKLLLDGTDIISRNLERISLLTHRLKDLNHLNGVLDKDCLEVEPFIQSIFIKSHAKHPLVATLKLDFDHTLKLLTQTQALEYVLKALIDNSFEHSETKDQALDIFIEITHHESTVKLIYKDNGRPISLEHLDGMFHPFYTTKDFKGHLGLGLYIAKEIAFLHLNGLLSYESFLNTGQFSLEFKAIQCK